MYQVNHPYTGRDLRATGHQHPFSPRMWSLRGMGDLISATTTNPNNNPPTTVADLRAWAGNHPKAMKALNRHPRLRRALVKRALRGLGDDSVDLSSYFSGFDTSGSSFDLSSLDNEIASVGQDILNSPVANFLQPSDVVAAASNSVISNSYCSAGSIQVGTDCFNPSNPLNALVTDTGQAIQGAPSWIGSLTSGLVNIGTTLTRNLTTPGGSYTITNPNGTVTTYQGTGAASSISALGLPGALNSGSSLLLIAGGVLLIMMMSKK